MNQIIHIYIYLNYIIIIICTDNKDHYYIFDTKEYLKTYFFLLNIYLYVLYYRQNYVFKIN